MRMGTANAVQDAGPEFQESHTCFQLLLCPITWLVILPLTCPLDDLMPNPDTDGFSLPGSLQPRTK